MSCFQNPGLGRMMGRAVRTSWCADSRVKPSYLIRYAMHKVALRLTPATQCTKVRPPLSLTCQKGGFLLTMKQDGRLAPAYFSQEHKYFDQHLPTVKNETIV